MPCKHHEEQHQRQRRKDRKIQCLGADALKLIVHLHLDIIGRTGQQYGSKRRDHADQNILYLYGGVIIAHIRLCGHNAQHYRIEIGVDCGGAGHGEEHQNRLHVPPHVIIPHRPEANVLPGMEQVHQIGCAGGKNADASIDHIVALLMDQHKHGHKGNHLKQDGTHRDIGILLQRLIEPFHADGRQEYGGAHHDIQGTILPERWHKSQRQPQGNIRQCAHQQVDGQQLMGCSGELFLIVPHHGAGADAIGGNTQLGKHIKIGD